MQIFYPIFTIFTIISSVFVIILYDIHQTSDIVSNFTLESEIPVIPEYSYTENKGFNIFDMPSNVTFQETFDFIKEEYNTGRKNPFIVREIEIPEENISNFRIKKYKHKDHLLYQSCFSYQIDYYIQAVRFDTYYGFLNAILLDNVDCLSPEIYEKEFLDSIKMHINGIKNRNRYQLEDNRKMVEYYDIKLLYLFYQRYLDCVNKRHNYIIYIDKGTASSVEDICFIIYDYLKNLLSRTIDFRKKYVIRKIIKRIINQKDRKHMKNQKYWINLAYSREKIESDKLLDSQLNSILVDNGVII